jgi:hypothetical protein
LHWLLKLEAQNLIAKDLIGFFSINRTSLNKSHFPAGTD